MTRYIVEPVLSVNSYAASSVEDRNARAGNNVDVLPDFIHSPWSSPARGSGDVFLSINGLAFLPGMGMRS